jgi:hypothetical protein
MESLEFLVQGSEPEPYRVTIERAGSNLRASCTCAAGRNGQFCKHRMRILSGVPDGILELDLDALHRALEWLSGTDVEVAITSLTHAEEEFERSKKELSKAKKRLAQALSD